MSFTSFFSTFTLVNTSYDLFKKTILIISSLTIYPPPPAPGGICISVEDYKCLAEGEFLNDVIIDFYLKYLVQTQLPSEHQKRTHVFSSHFFTRLTRELSLDESGDSSRKKKRHEGVQRWTKNINIFDKDFIVVPINQQWVTFYID